MLVLSMPSRWNDWFSPLVENDVVQMISIIGAVRKYLLRFEPSNEVTGWSLVILLSWPELETNRQSQCDYSMDFAAKSTSGATESLGLRSPLFRRPPAACA